jgi:hypothetical protein
MVRRRLASSQESITPDAERRCRHACKRRFAAPAPRKPQQPGKIQLDVPIGSHCQGQNPRGYHSDVVFGIEGRTWVIVDSNAIHAAARIVYTHMTPTPQYCWPMLCRYLAAEVWVKHENHAPTGAFKVRGGGCVF